MKKIRRDRDLNPGPRLPTPLFSRRSALQTELSQACHVITNFFHRQLPYKAATYVQAEFHLYQI